MDLTEETASGFTAAQMSTLRTMIAKAVATAMNVAINQDLPTAAAPYRHAYDNEWPKWEEYTAVRMNREQTQEPPRVEPQSTEKQHPQIKISQPLADTPEKLKDNLSENSPQDLPRLQSEPAQTLLQQAARLQPISPEGDNLSADRPQEPCESYGEGQTISQPHLQLVPIFPCRKHQAIIEYSPVTTEGQNLYHLTEDDKFPSKITHRPEPPDDGIT
jgi:hypothetical protein